MADDMLTAFSVDTEEVARAEPSEVCPDYPVSYLVVDGREVPVQEWPDYALRFGTRGDLGPSLYHHGRRVTKAWKTHLLIDWPADPYGDNANTDG